MSLIPQEVQRSCEVLLAAPLLRVAPVAGGDINEARLLHTENGAYFLKMNTKPQAFDMFQTEAKGLQLIQQSGLIATPEIIATENTSERAFLLLSYIPPGQKTDSFWEKFGQQLALLHQQNNSKHFGLDHHNYIGNLPQNNQWEDSWTAFYIRHRLAPQVKMAVDKGLFNKEMILQFDQLYLKLDELCPAEPPALIHGDLWSGNFLADNMGRPVLIDPAVCYAHREMDLAMTHLFGGFGARFYQAYESTYPLEKGFSSRMEIYQLYYLLVHVNLFGGHYVQSVRSVLARN